MARRIASGETNVKGAAFGGCYEVYIRAVAAGRDDAAIDAALIEAASDAVRGTYSLLCDLDAFGEGVRSGRPGPAAATAMTAQGHPQASLSHQEIDWSSVFQHGAVGAGAAPSLTAAVVNGLSYDAGGLPQDGDETMFGDWDGEDSMLARWAWDETVSFCFRSNVLPPLRS
jgi:hypothetical protein